MSKYSCRTMPFSDNPGTVVQMEYPTPGVSPEYNITYVGQDFAKALVDKFGSEKNWAPTILSCVGAALKAKADDIRRNRVVWRLGVLVFEMRIEPSESVALALQSLAIDPKNIVIEVSFENAQDGVGKNAGEIVMAAAEEIRDFPSGACNPRPITPVGRPLVDLEGGI